LSASDTAGSILLAARFAGSAIRCTPSEHRRPQVSA
jgi:hypothetical protein